MTIVLGVVKSGPDWELEAEAHALLVKDRKARGLLSIKVNSEEYSWLTLEQLEFRQKREVYTSIGHPDPNIIEGRVFRAYNPLFGTRPTGLLVGD